MSKASEATVVEIPPLATRNAQVVVVGDTPLIVHAWGNKAKGIQRDQEKGAKAGRKAKNWEAEYQDARYFDEDGNDALKAIAFKKAAVGAARFTGDVMTRLRMAFFVDGFYVRLYGPGPKMRGPEPMNLPKGGVDMRVRPQFDEWWSILNISYNENAVSLEQIVNLLNHAGFHVGCGENRPEKTGDTFGRFHVAGAEEAQALLDTLEEAA